MLKDINVVITEKRANMEAYIENSRQRIIKNTEDSIKQIEKNRAILPELLDIVPDMDLYEWQTGEELSIDLGMKPTRGKAAKAAFAKKLQDLRKLLGKIQMHYKDVADAQKRTVRVYLSVPDYPGIQIRYMTKMGRNAKCKIVKHVSHSLLCEI